MIRPLPVSLTQELIHDIIEWDVNVWAQCLAVWTPTLQQFDVMNTRVLCIGERNGGLSLWFALLGFQVVCSDIKPPSVRAKELHAKYNVQDRIQYEQLDVFRLPFGKDSFDIVAAKSVLGGLKFHYQDRGSRTLENQYRAVAEIRRILKTGGVFLSAENLQGSPLHMLLHRDRRLRRNWRYLSLEEYRYLFSDFRSFDFVPFGFLSFGGKSSLFSWIINVVNKTAIVFLPKRWCYVGGGVASK
ncbi:MAG: class I SAM-dependent methyltransferase [Cyclobacteriaceae bacterium]|nr:class I SAM-dependent methyltransferase [Cyclobacteriaceae bacterium]